MILYMRKETATVLKRLGIKELRPWQREAMEAVYRGNDTFVRCQTGGGKSLIYQLPAAVEQGRGITLVLSPTRTLQVDQVSKLCDKGIPAVLINSDLAKSERRNILAHLGDYALLYAAPEQLERDDFTEALRCIGLLRVVVDEAHILYDSELGFRKAYGRIRQFIESLTDRPQIMALTATATGVMQKRICKALGMCHPTVFTFPVRRENLRLTIKEVSGKCEGSVPYPEAMLKMMEGYLYDWGSKSGSAIIYCTKRKQVSFVKHWLKCRGWDCTSITGKTKAENRKKRQKAFLNGKIPIMVATNAFGLGIDKPDVRLVINMGLPLGLDEWVQEFGRAGRDGRKSDCVLLYTPKDVKGCRKIIGDDDNNSPKKEEDVKRKLKSLYALDELVHDPKCIWKQIEAYYGEKAGSSCGSCSRCINRKAKQGKKF